MIVDHICFAVKNLETAIKQWTGAFDYEQMTEVVCNTRQQVKVVFLSKEESVTIKLIGIEKKPFYQNKNI